MKLCDIDDRIWWRHIRLDSINKRRRLKLLRTGKGTDEQLQLAAVCIKLDNSLMKYATKQIKSK